MPVTWESSFATMLTRRILDLFSSIGVWKITASALEKAAHRYLVTQGDPIEFGPRRAREDTYYIASNLVRTILKAYDRGSDGVRDKMATLFLREFLQAPGDKPEHQRFAERYDRFPPQFLTVSPTGKCNLSCADCYAASPMEKPPG